MLMKDSKNNCAKNGRGRPPKFTEARRPITVTMPERTLRQLATLSEDRAVAIVKAVDAVCASGPDSGKLVQVVQVSSDDAIILVPPSKTLKRIPFLRLVEVSPAKFLLVIPSGMPVDSLEIAVADLLENLSSEDEPEKSVLEALKSILSQQRHRKKLTKAELLFVEAKQIYHGSVFVNRS